jgi:hypothetical protein
MPEINPNDPFVKEVFQFLTELRDSGKTNMFGAGPYLQKAYGFDPNTARRFLTAWIQSFNA